MKWVTWSNVGVDRMGCAWLIRRWLDPDAEFVFIAEGSHDVPTDAEPFDIPGVRLSHHGGHCSFHTLLTAYDLKDLLLARIARIIDEADTVTEVELEPIAPGLDVLCRGLRRTSPMIWPHWTVERYSLRRSMPNWKREMAKDACSALAGAHGGYFSRD